VNRKQRRAAAKRERALADQHGRRIAPDTARIAFERDLATARKLHQAGCFADAEVCYRQLLAARPNHAEALNLLGVVAHQTGRHDLAVEVIRQAIDQDPLNPAYFSNLGSALHGRGDLDDAIRAFRRAIAIKWDSAEVYSNLGVTLREQGKIDEAVVAYTHALSINPNYGEAHANLGLALYARGELERAIRHYRQAIRVKPTYPDAHSDLGVALYRQGKLGEAVAAFRQAISIQPGFAKAYSNLGVALEELGKIEEALSAFERAIKLAPSNANTYRLLADIKQFSPSDQYLQAMEKLAERMTSLSVGDQIELHFALAKAYDDIAEHDRSFRHLVEGNTLRRQQLTYDEAASLNVFNRVQETFTSELMREMGGFGDPSDLPAFIVGMPRSGTTLVEQIISSHPKVFGAGELGYVLRAVAELSGQDLQSTFIPDIAPSLSREQVYQFGVRYVSAITALAPRAERITDKMPINFLYIGLLHLALPNARIVHVRRNALDTCFSCFSKLFEGDQRFTYNLAELGRFYRAYEAMMEHWRKILPPGIMLEVQYESLVSNFEDEARRIVEHCGLEWDGACLAFHRTERPVRTASAHQVRRPLYSSSIGRWHPYARQLEPLAQVLRT
jgi:tetratricopeptide (TPR) repeat protein